MDTTWSKVDGGLFIRSARPGHRQHYHVIPRTTTYKGGFRARIVLEDCGTVADALKPFDYSRHDSYVFPTVYGSRADALERAKREAANVLDTKCWPSGG